MKADTLSRDNFRQWAQTAITRYFESGRLGDAVLWQAIVAQYETALARKDPWWKRNR